MYEMGAGRVLSGISPEESDYDAVKNEAVRDAIKFIFNTSDNSIENVRHHLHTVATFSS